MQLRLHPYVLPVVTAVLGSALLGTTLYLAITCSRAPDVAVAPAPIFTTTVTLNTESLHSRSETDSSTWLLHSTFPTLQTQTPPVWTLPNMSSQGVLHAHYSMGYFGVPRIALDQLKELKYITYAFAVGANTPGTAYWEETTPDISVVSTLKERGGDIIVAFGGEASCRTRTEPALRGWSPADIARAYEAILNLHGSRYLDLDIELGTEKEAATYTSRNLALVLLAQKRPDIVVSYTLPASAAGISGMELLKDALERNLRIHTVRPMAMFWGYVVNIVEVTKQLLINARRQLDEADMSETFLGYTPLLGSDDIGNVQTVDVTRQVAMFIEANPQLKVCTFAYWELGRDPGFESAKVLLNMKITQQCSN